MDHEKQYHDNYQSILHDVVYGLPKASDATGAAGSDHSLTPSVTYLLTCSVGITAMTNTPKSVNITVYGHKVTVPKVICGRKIAVFTFNELCATALGAADYIDIGQSITSPLAY